MAARGCRGCDYESIKRENHFKTLAIQKIISIRPLVKVLGRRLPPPPSADFAKAGNNAWRTLMTNTMNSHDSSRLNATFLEEYNSEDSIRKYTRNTAGDGIGYLLEHEYGKIYLYCINRYVPKSRLKKGIRLWEFVCGGGMNLLHLVATLERRGIPVEFALSLIHIS